MINPAIFREYDIRGVWGKDLTEEIIQSIGKAFAVYLSNKLKRNHLKISIGRDVRLSSPAIFDALARGFLDSGIDIVDIGICPTEVEYIFPETCV